ncbi:polysaccharide pyruvyl transferase [Ruminiclostridium sufflavum DSM 19573]|uniref:Polysaccharide pyruvyl transferase n=1 Tax=Ruminiclostridium sufflavum DSM 19573 TaxID=1121337 RepID=A0A318XKT7_9FIRM|nr:polysaccharide pyruvyl transferase family protein [Ruminiclostridium sufflavum]PYG87800.1 polysaccharide pyruvyl transferase [Ruminiclostridium sufflavum DSM 19573]
MKALILTYHYLDNYGAVLQAFALQRYLSQSGIDAKILDYRPGLYGFGDYTFLLKDARLPAKFKKFIYGNIKALLSIKRKKNFRLFSEKYLNRTEKKYRDVNSLEKSAPYADIYITGSDQVWNDDILGLCEGYFLTFVKNESLKASYAASIGKDTISPAYAERLKKYLDSFDFISVREEAAKAALENAGLKAVLTVLDPVFLLGPEAYEDLMTKPAIDDYVFIYCFDSNEQCYSLAKILAERNHLKTISFSGWFNKFHTDYFVNTASPAEFLSYLRNAEYVVTNSFHGTAFSILFEKEFYSVPPVSRVSRIESLLYAVNLQDRMLHNNEKLEAIEAIDYQAVKGYLSQGIEKSKAYLKSVIDAAGRRKRKNE